MEFIIFVTIIVIALFALLISSVIDDAGYNLRSEVETKKTNNNPQKKNAFKRLGLVEGILYDNGKFYKTFNTGNIEIEDASGSITIGFDVTLDGCYFGDICINGISIRSGMPKFSDYESEINYVIGLFNTAKSAGVLSSNLVERAIKLINEYQEFAILLEEKVIVQPRGTADYAWG